MRLGVDVGIDAHRNSRSAALARRDRRKHLQFRFGFDIDAEDVFIDGEREFGRGLADAGEHDLVGGHAGERARA